MSDMDTTPAGDAPVLPTTNTSVDGGKDNDRSAASSPMDEGDEKHDSGPNKAADVDCNKDDDTFTSAATEENQDQSESRSMSGDVENGSGEEMDTHDSKHDDNKCDENAKNVSNTIDDSATTVTVGGGGEKISGVESEKNLENNCTKNVLNDGIVEGGSGNLGNVKQEAMCVEVETKVPNTDSGPVDGDGETKDVVKADVCAIGDSEQTRDQDGHATVQSVEHGHSRSKDDSCVSGKESTKTEREEEKSMDLFSPLPISSKDDSSISNSDVKSTEASVVENRLAPSCDKAAALESDPIPVSSSGEGNDGVVKTNDQEQTDKLKHSSGGDNTKQKEEKKDKEGSSSSGGGGGSDEKKYQICIVHNKEAESFLCKACDFTNKGHGFEEHLMCHLMLRPYQCLYCKECFINRREISRHVLKAHNGAKMSCALRALKRAKAIIKEVSNTGTLFFMARVQGKVPLEKDPDRHKESNVADAEKTVKVKERDEKKNVEDTNEQLKEETVKPSEEKVVHQTKVDEKPDNNEKVSGSTQSASLLFNTSVASNSFSKLREVLTSSVNPDNNSTTSDSSSNNKDNSSSNSSINSSVPKSSSDSSGIKILASYSLHEDKPSSTSRSSSLSSSSSSNKEATSKSAVESNFIMAGPSASPENEPETLSFLGPERPIFKADSPSQSHSIIPTPSPFSSSSSRHLSSTSSSSSSNITTPLPPPPLLASASWQPKQQKKVVKPPDFFICGFDCSFTCIDKASLLQHLKDIHSSNADFPCHYCGYRDVSEEALVNHVADHADSHDKTKPLYECAYDDCAFTSNMVSDFINHTKTSHCDKDKDSTATSPIPADRQPTCKVCGMSFSDISSFQTHLEDNIIHIVNCPHCPSKATERRAILNHISSQHPGKPKMVSVAKQLICNARRENGYWKTVRDSAEMPPPSLTPAPSHSGPSSSTSVVDQILRRATNGTLMADDSIARRLSDVASEGSHSPRSESSAISSGVHVKEELTDGESAEAGGDNESSNYIIDEHGVRRRIYVPMSERQAENFRCNFCTFVARDVKRLACHERSHGMPPTRKDRFKCMFCPQGFDSELKFRLHITCHPGLIKFLLYKCKKCEFDSNQKHTIVKHITCNRDKKHRGTGPVEDQYTIISRSLESRVLECEHCSYMTRHKIHMAIHYQREHGILRDKSDFRIEGLTPTDTPFSGHDTTRVPDIPMAQLHHKTTHNSSSSSSLDSDYKRPPYKKSKLNDRPSSSGASSSTDYSSMSVNEINERNELFNRLVSQQSALQPGHVLENQARKFKCPICKYLLPKAADLKNHVKRHSEVGQITLVMFRCKYCSCMSTARELLYEHLGEKHPGKPIALVKKIVFIDTTEVDKSFAETAVEENLQQLEESVHNEIMSAINSNVSKSSNKQSESRSPSPSPAASFEQLFVIPEGGDTFAAALHCPKCSFNSHNRQEIIYHVTSTHPEVKVISSDDDVEKLAKATTKDLHRSKSDNAMAMATKSDMSVSSGSGKQNSSSSAGSAWLDTIEEVLIVPDDQVFKEPALCSRCDFSTILRKDMVTHLQQYHTEIAVMGRNSYPIQVSAIGTKMGMMPEPSDDSCVVGSGSLDNRLRCLYENYGSQMKCLICGVDRPKKFFIHVHILRHLNIFLWKCSYCAHRGLQKYKMVDHIKKVHPGKPMSVRYLRVNVESRVSQFLSQFNVLQNSSQYVDGGGGGDDDGGIGIGSNVGVGVGDAGGNNSNSNSRDGGEEDYATLELPLPEVGAENSSSSPPPPPPPPSNPPTHVQVPPMMTGSSREYLMHEDENAKDGVSGGGVEGDEGGMSIQTSAGSTYVLGSDALDEKISCLYQVSPMGTYGCLACVNQFQRKFAIHRHIIISHLKVALLSCCYCGMQGVEKHQMVDHCLACHPGQSVSFSNNSVDLDKAVSGFLADSCHVDKKAGGLLSESEKGELIALMKTWNSSSNKNSMYRGFNPEGVKIKRPYNKKPGGSIHPPFGSPLSLAKKLPGSSYKPRTVVDPGVIMLGREALDKELNCLYQPRGGGHFRCLICRWEFPRKYPLHRHIMLKHLRMNLVGCPYCPYEGVEKYTVSAHIKEEHKDMPVSIKYVQPDVGTRVRHFVEDMANGISTSQDLIRRPSGGGGGGGGGGHLRSSSPSSISSSHSTLSALIKMKREKSFDDFADDDNDDANSNDGDGENDRAGERSGAQGLVVAMFGKKNKSVINSGGDNDSNNTNQDDIVVKTEIEDEEFEEGSKLEDDDAVDDNVNVYFGPSGGDQNENSNNNNDDNYEEGEEEDDNDEEGGGGGQPGRPGYFEEEEMMAGDTGDDDPAADKEARMRAIREKFLKSQSYGSIKRPQAYAPGSYRSPNGGKPKALDVITKIKVLKAKEGPITKFCCEKCTFTSVHRSNVVRHIYKIHEKYQTHVCPVCNYQTLSLILMQTHMGKSHPGVEYTEESFNINPPRSKPRSKPLMGPLSFQRRRSPKYALHSPRTPSSSLSSPHNEGSNDQLPSDPSSTTPSTGPHSGPKQYCCAYCHYETNTQGDILAHTREKHTNSYNATTNSSSGGMNYNGDGATATDSHDFGDDGEFPDAGSIDDTASDACWERSKKAVKRKVSGSGSGGAYAPCAPSSDTLISGMVRSKRKFVFEKGEELIQCGYCEVRETSMGRMQHHFDWEHPDTDVKCKRIPSWRFVCKTCSVKTMATSKMKYHLNRHVSYRPYTCVNCGAFFPSPDQCRRHARSAGHEEQYVYIHNTKKEQRVEELLQATRQLALKIQEDAAHDPDFDIGQIDAFLARYQDVKHNLKRVGVGSSPRSSKKSKSSSYDGDEDYKTRARTPAKSVQTLGVEMDITIQCYICKFESSTVHQVFQHHEATHPGQKFFWTELERGFTCDRTGEALLNSVNGSFPSASEEVGYSTKMTLGSGSKTMRFKCKSCEFSSCVIQAMKSHLKSHQPKGFICAYCSRSFSGKEKLMRHQYCLHKGMATWVIHLRKASSATLANTVLPQTIPPSTVTQTSQHGQASTDGAPVCYVCNKCPYTSDDFFKYRRHLGIHKEFRQKKTTASDGDGVALNADDSDVPQTSGVNSEACKDGDRNDIDGGDDNDNEEEGDDDAVGSDDDNGGEERVSSSFKCGHCEFSASEKEAIEAHHNSEHPDDEPITIDLSSSSSTKRRRDADRSRVGSGKKRKVSDVVLDLEPQVKMRRISKSTLEAYNEDETRFINYDDDEENVEVGAVDGDVEEEESGGLVAEGSVDLRDGEHSEMFSDETFHETELGDEEERELDEEVEEEEEDEDNDDADDGMKTEKVHSEHQRVSLKLKLTGVLKPKNRTLSHNDSGGNDDDEDEGEEEEDEGLEEEGGEEEEEEEEGDDDYHEGVSSPIAEDSEELARQLGLVENQHMTVTSSDLLVGADDSSDMMIMEFNGMKSRGGSSRNSPSSLSLKDGGGGGGSQSNSNSGVGESGRKKIGVSRSGDKGSYNDEDDDDFDDEDDDDEEDYENVNVSLGSPLPMISLGDDMETI